MKGIIKLTQEHQQMHLYCTVTYCQLTTHFHRFSDHHIGSCTRVLTLSYVMTRVLLPVLTMQHVMTRGIVSTNNTVCDDTCCVVSTDNTVYNDT